MKRVLLALIAFALSACAFAKPHQLSWAWPTEYCLEEGQTIPDALSAGDLVESELIYSLSPIPMPSDSAGPCAATRDPDAPAGTISVPIPVTDTSVILNLTPGTTYYARIRVSAPVAGNWSSWSTQKQFTVPYGRPNVIQFSSGSSPLDRHVFVMVSSTRLNFFGGS